MLNQQPKTGANRKPMVSVVMPVYNVEAYVCEAIDSVLSQTFANFELIIVDDQSPDHSIELIEYMYHDSRIKIVRQRNRGLAGARNTGIRNAQGRYIAFLDSDDFWQKHKLELHLAQFQKHPNCSVSFSASMFVNEQSKMLSRIQSPSLKLGYTASDVFTRNLIGNGSAPVIRKSVLEQIAFTGNNKYGQATDYWQYFDESLKQSEDIDCWTRIALYSASEFHLIDQPLTNYRVNNEGLSSDVSTQFETWMAFIEKIAKHSPQFCKQHRARAKAFQCRYLARRCISQGDGRQALTWMLRAFRYQPVALFRELHKTVTTSAASLLLSLLPRSYQAQLISRVFG